MSDRHRLFVAADVPLAERERVEAAVSDLREELPGGRWTPVEAQHITLKFLGWVESGRVGEVAEACRSVSTEVQGAEVRLDGLGVFPSLKRVRVLWVGLIDAGGVMTTLAEALDRRMEDVGIAPEARTYTAHLTLARFKTPFRWESMPELTMEPEAFRIDDIVLYESHLGSKGARYEVVERFPLA